MICVFYRALYEILLCFEWYSSLWVILFLFLLCWGEDLDIAYGKSNVSNNKYLFSENTSQMKPPVAQVCIVHLYTFSISLTLCRKKITTKFSITNWCHNIKKTPKKSHQQQSPKHCCLQRCIEKIIDTELPWRTLHWSQVQRNIYIFNTELYSKSH